MSTPARRPGLRLLSTLPAALLAGALAAGCASAGSHARPGPVAGPGAYVDLGDASALDAAVDRARVVLVGEFHDQRGHHEVQRATLERMAARPGPLLLGMEMFYRPQQAALDEYVQGKIDEREMLRRSGWYGPNGWGSDHTLYAPLWRLCRERGGRVIALNAERAVTRRISAGGIAGLAPEERARMAKEVDLGVAAHRERIMGMFLGGAHRMPADSLQRMYEAMTTWDETMAETAANALADAGPGSRMLVVAGNGHVEGFDGVPNRLARRVPGLRPLVVGCSLVGDLGDEPFPWDVANFVVRTMPNERGETPKLGVQFEKDTLKVEKVVDGGNAARLGVRAGDVLTSASTQDGRLVALKDLTDLKWVLEELWAAGGKGGFLVWTRDGYRHAVSLDLEPEMPAHHPPIPAKP